MGTQEFKYFINEDLREEPIDKALFEKGIARLEAELTKEKPEREQAN